MQLVKSTCFDTVTKMLYNFNDETDTSVTKIFSEEEDGDDWSHSTIESEDNLSAKTPVTKQNLV
jgi:hypothetical protein